jgi:hypothetical protein
MGLLDEIIDGASSGAVSTTNLLRKVQTLAHRIGAGDLTAWVRAELQGYEPDAAIPAYRGPFTTHVFGVYSGPFNSGGENTVSPAGVPAAYLDLFQVGWRVSIAEIENLSRSAEEVVQPWDPLSIAKYNEWIDAGLVPRVPMFYLYSARKMISTAMLGSIVEAVRTKHLSWHSICNQRIRPPAR